MLVFAFALAAAAPLDLHLVCTGGGTQSKPNSTSLYATNGNGDYSSATINGSSTADFADTVRIDITGQTGRIRVPQMMMPPIHGGKAGWFDLRKISATGDEIDAVATINFLNKVKLRLDRLTGDATFTVLHGQFAGHCVPFDPATAPRAF
jgi:hypothetical protein